MVFWGFDNFSILSIDLIHPHCVFPGGLFHRFRVDSFDLRDLFDYIRKEKRRIPFSAVRRGSQIGTVCLNQDPLQRKIPCSVWEEQRFICGKNPVFPEQEAPGRYFFPAVLWAVFSARTGNFLMAVLEKRSAKNGLQRFFWNFRKKGRPISTW